MSLLGLLVHLFWILVTSPLGFKARVGSVLLPFYGGKCNVHSPRSTSGAIPANLLTASHYMRSSAEVGNGEGSPAEKTNALSFEFFLYSQSLTGLTGFHAKPPLIAVRPVGPCE